MDTQVTMEDVLIGISVFLTLVVLYNLAFWFLTDHKGRKMGRDSAIAANIVWNGFETAYDNGEISRKYMRYWIKRIGKEAGIPDLLPIQYKLSSKLHPYKVNRLKEQIKWRLKNLYRGEGDKSQEYPKVIPGPGPTEERGGAKKKEVFKQFFDNSNRKAA